MHFEILGSVEDVEIIAIGRRIRELGRLIRRYGTGRWRKMKGRAMVRLPGGRVGLAEIHWYVAHGPGPREFKRKRWLD